MSDATTDAEAGGLRRASPVPRATWMLVVVLVAAAVLVGALGGFWLGGVSEGPAGAEPRPLEPGDVDSRVDELGAEGETREAEPQDDAEPSAEPGPENASATAPVDDAIAARIAEEEAWLAERARLATDAPLTPAVTEASELVKRWRPEAPETDAAADPAPAPASGGVAALTAGIAAGHADVAPGLPPVSPALASTHVLARGSVIPAVLESSIDSDLPGLVRAKIAENVYDTVTGRHLVVPKGSWLVGTYGSNTRAGQRRLFVVWTDLRLPDGTSLALNDTGSLGDDGASGIKGRRSTGIWTALGAAVLFDLAGNASRILIASETGEAPGRQAGLAELIGGSVGNSTSQVAQQYIGEILDRGTRFKVDAGARMNVLVEKDMHLPAQPAPEGL